MEGLPQHIAIIMDGNGRWAQSHGYPRIQGHRVGSRNLRRIATHASNQGVKILTLYAFSEENWSRPEREVRLLMLLLKIYAIRERTILMKHNIRLQVIGHWEKLPPVARSALEQTIRLTSQNTGMILQLALSYGSRQEILDATQALAAKVKRGELEASSITEEEFNKHLGTAGQPDPDLVIRTSGEMRISNFLLWQSAYAEFYFSPKYWPDFSEADFDEAVAEFSRRERRFGGILPQELRESAP